MKVSLIVFSALFAFAGTVSAGGYGMPYGEKVADARKSVPGIGDAIFSPGVTEKNTQDPRISNGQGWGTGKGDAKRKYIGETEKNLYKAPPPAATPVTIPKPAATPVPIPEPEATPINLPKPPPPEGLPIPIPVPTP